MAFPSRACPRGVPYTPRGWNQPRALTLPVVGFPQALGTQHILSPPSPEVAWCSLGGVSLALRSSGSKACPALGLRASPPFPGYRTRELWDSSGVLSSPVVPGFPAVPPSSSADPSLSWTALLSQRGHSDPALTGPGSASSAPRRGCEQSGKELVFFLRAPPRTQAPPPPLRAPDP